MVVVVATVDDLSDTLVGELLSFLEEKLFVLLCEVREVWAVPEGPRVPIEAAPTLWPKLSDDLLLSTRTGTALIDRESPRRAVWVSAFDRLLDGPASLENIIVLLYLLINLPFCLFQVRKLSLGATYLLRIYWEFAKRLVAPSLRRWVNVPGSANINVYFALEWDRIYQGYVAAI